MWALSVTWKFKGGSARLFLIMMETEAEQAGSTDSIGPSSAAPSPGCSTSMLQKCKIPYYQDPAMLTFPECLPMLYA